MAKQYKSAGKSTREMGSRRRIVMLAIGVIGILVLIGLGQIIHDAKGLGIGGVGLLFLIMLLPVIPRITDRFMAQKEREVRRAYRGARAEEEIEVILATLDRENYAVYHDISCPYGNIDHVVISRQKGVFLLETKSHGGKVEAANVGLLVNGKLPEKDFIAQTLKNTYWLRNYLQDATALKIWIKPVIVFTNAFVVSGKPIKNVAIINKKYLQQFIQRQPNHPANESLWIQREKIRRALSQP